MPQSLAQLYTHVVFSTKNRVAYLDDVELRDRVHAYLGGACGKLNSPSLIVGGPSDHVHILCSMNRNQAVAELVRELKRESSKWVKEQASTLNDFHWQGGYGAFSVSPSHVEILREYIATQAAHHEKVTFKDEFRRLLEKYNLQFDEQYVWD